MKSKYYFVLVFFVFFIAFFLRFYNLSNVPPSLEQDETSIGYNAYSILRTGKDEYGKFFPVYFKAFGEYKLPLYIYSSVIPIKLFGLNEFGVRFISAFFGSLTIIVFFFLIKKLTGKTNLILPLLSSFFLAINPWHLHLSRGAFEVTLALFFIILGVFLFIKSTEKKGYLLLIAILSLVLSIYTYNIARLFTPFLILFLFYWYRRDLFSKSKGMLFSSLLSLVILGIILLLNIFTNGGIKSTEGTLIFSSSTTQAPLIELRSYFIDFPPIFTKIFFGSFTLTFLQYIKNILNYFSVSFFFISGSSHGNHGIGNVGQLYLFEFPLVIFGLIKIMREKIKWGYLFISWGILVILTASLTREVPQATRSFFIIIPFEVFSAIGALYIFNFIKNIKVKFYRNIIILISLAFIIYNLIFYFSSYYIRFPVFYAKEWRYADKILSLYLKENGYKYDKIIFDNKAGFMYSSLLFYLTVEPSDFQETVIREVDDSEGFSRVLSFGKYEFKNIDWSKDYKQPKILIITTPDKKPDEVSSLKVFYYPKRPVVFSVGQQIIQYPVEEIAYVAIETK